MKNNKLALLQVNVRMSYRDPWMTVLLIRKSRGSWRVPVRSGIITIRVENRSTNVKIKFNNLCLTTIPGNNSLKNLKFSQAFLVLSYSWLWLTSMHLSLILNADTYYAVHIANIILTDLLYSIIYYFLLPFAAYLITALGTFMSIGLRRPSIREHLLTYLLELLASIQRHGLKALHPTPSPHYLDHWVEPVQIRVSLIMIFASSQVWPLSHRRLLLQVYLILVHFLVLFHYIALISFFILCAVSSQFLSSPSSHYSNVRFFVQKFNFDKTLLLSLFSRQIKLVKKLKKHTKPQHFYDFDFSWNQSCQQLKSANPQY